MDAGGIECLPGGGIRRRQTCVVSALWLFPAAVFGQTCVRCHPAETLGFSTTPMANSMSAAGLQPEGAFEHQFSHTKFTIRNTQGGAVQHLERRGSSESMLFQYAIGSGAHAFGYLAQVGDHLFQSPLSYYTLRKQWDMAPGYENDRAPNFLRPVTQECVFCHSGVARPIRQTINSYESPPFNALGITCERCHGSAERHLKNPVPGSIVNPARSPAAQRDSVCEQCHLTGVVRIANAGGAITGFRPGQTLEANYTVYVGERQPDGTVRVISQAEQLALSVCKRRSGERMWCGTCHNPHQRPAEPVEYFRKRCLACHAATLAAKHAELGNCMACHMPRLPASDGGHTAFTDHRISRDPARFDTTGIPTGLAAWREPPANQRDRNLALALVTVGLESQDSEKVTRGYRMIARLPSAQRQDPDVLTAVGNILLITKQPEEASKRFAEALSLRPDYAPYEVNLAAALLESNRLPESIKHLERAVQLDPLLQKAVSMLASGYQREGDTEKATELISRYRSATGISSLKSR